VVIRDDEGKKEHKHKTGKKKVLTAKSRFEIQSAQAHIVGECVFLSFNLQQIPNISE
jgi:hypothetical protein